MELEQQLAAAAAAIQTLGLDYVERTLEDISRARAIVKDTNADGNVSEPGCNALFLIFHDIKGQGTTFDYPLVTHIGTSLCTLLREDKVLNSKDLHIIQHHIAALTLVLKHEISGDGGPLGQKLLSRLADIAAAV